MMLDISSQPSSMVDSAVFYISMTNSVMNVHI